jgi:hypothetical protein
MPDFGAQIAGLGARVITPYAEAIMACYASVVPSFQTVQLNLTGATVEQRLILSDRSQFDQLFFSCHIQGFNNDNGDNGQIVFMNVDDLRSGRSWVAPTPVGFAPLTAFGGVDNQATPNLRMPEAFFLPGNVRLRHYINNLTNSQATGGTVTWVGVQLAQPFEGKTPECVQMINGDVVRVGDRAPLFLSVGLGRKSFVGGVTTYSVGAGSRYLAYTPPIGCDVEIHDISANFFSEFGTPVGAEAVEFQVVDVGARKMYGPTQNYSQSLMGDFTKVFPAMPFSRPYLLKKGHRLQLSVQNNINPNLALTNAFAVIRGVRLCEY